MAEILTLREVFRKEGIQFIEKLFNSYVIISEKLNATRFAFEKTEEGKIIFYKKDGKITSIERTLNQIFEEPISYIENLPKTVFDKIPSGYRYGFRYFHSSTPINIQYDRIPLNGLILTDMMKISDEKIVDDPSIVNSIAKVLKVEKPPIVWYGKLSDEQKEKLKNYLRSSEESLINKYKTDSFTKFIISLLNPSMKKTALNNDIEKPIDSVVFKFIGEDRREIFYAKTIDPIIHQLNKTNEKDREPQDMYGIILSDIIEFIKINGIKKYNIPLGDSEERYLHLMCKIFNDYIKKRGFKYEGVELDKNSFRSIPQFDLNSGFIPDLQTRNLLIQSGVNKNIFKIIVSSFYRPKRKANGFITQMMISDLSDIVNRIKEKVENISSKNENSIMTFEEYLSIKKEKSFKIKD
jgi:hypothetical protein